MEALKLSYFRVEDRESYVESFISGFDKTRLHLVSWMPKTAPRVILMMVHGSGDHILRYDQWANKFTGNKIGVVGIDFRGHGKSEGRRGQGTLYELNKDIGSLVDYTRKMYPAIPRLLYGQGLGASLCMNYMLKNHSGVNGILALSPLLKSVNIPGFLLKKSGKLMASLFPRYLLPNGHDACYLSRDEMVVKSAETDPMIHYKISAGLFLEILDSGNQILQNRHRINVPLLVMHGSKDKIASWRAASELCQYTSHNTSFKSWDNCYHELHHDFDKENVFAYIGSWIGQLPLNRR